MSLGKRKRQFAEPQDVNAFRPDGISTTKPSMRKDGSARQAKSERRSKKKIASEPTYESISEENDHVQSATVQEGQAISRAENATATDEPFQEPPEAATLKTSSPSHSMRKNAVRFIAFVGNLPYSTTDAALAAHFSKLNPTSIRHSTNPSTGKSKGFAFLEFDHYDKMKTCLKLYHHSLFDPEQTRAKIDKDDDSTPHQEEPGFAHNDDKAEKYKRPSVNKARRINVELTAGGGGRSVARKDRIKSKNQKLKEERDRLRKKDVAQRAKRQQEKALGTGANSSVVGEGTGVDQSSTDGQTRHIHPSRLSRVAR